MSYELAQKYAAFDVPAELKSAHRAGMQLVGSLAFTKMMLFANEVKLTNNDVDYYMSLRPTRQEDETQDDFIARSKFSKALLIYRAQFYDYSVYEKQ